MHGVQTVGNRKCGIRSAYPVHPGQKYTSYSARLMSARSEESIRGKGRHREWRATSTLYTFRKIMASWGIGGLAVSSLAFASRHAVLLTAENAEHRRED